MLCAKFDWILPDGSGGKKIKCEKFTGRPTDGKQAIRNNSSFPYYKYLPNLPSRKVNSEQWPMFRSAREYMLACAFCC